MAVLVAFVYLDLRHMGQEKYEPNSLCWEAHRLLSIDAVHHPSPAYSSLLHGWNTCEY